MEYLFVITFVANTPPMCLIYNIAVQPEGKNFVLTSTPGQHAPLQRH